MDIKTTRKVVTIGFTICIFASLIGIFFGAFVGYFAVKMLAYRSGLYASFLPKPLFDESGSGFHISLSCHRNGGSFDDVRESMAAGILRRIPEITVFLNPVAHALVSVVGSMEGPYK